MQQTPAPWLPKLVLVAVALGFVVACNRSDEFAIAIVRADEVVLLEGLPHGTFEPELLESERRSKPVRESHGHPFYEPPLALSAADANRLTQILSQPTTFERFGGEKKCGGFHPDYAVEWHRGAAQYQAQICFGCGEAKLFGPGLDGRYDLGGDAVAELEVVLGRYRKLRPAGFGPGSR